MKKVRLLAFLMIIGLVASDPALVLEGFEFSPCCNEFVNHCSDTCDALNESMLATDCWGMTCTEYCFCSETIHEHPGGTYCSPCA